MMRRLMTRFLEPLGVMIVEASNESDVKKLFNKTEFDIALVDVNLGANDGINLAIYLRELHPLLQIIVISGDHTNKDRVREAGLGRILLKPFSLAELMEHLPQKIKKP